MSEMLGNQYFLTRNYSKAVSIYSRINKIEPKNILVKKRLIICFTQIGEMSKAFDFFYELVSEDIEAIINTDLIEDDCPCLELTKRYGMILPYEKNSIDLKLMLGMLWLYCDIEKSLGFFNELLVSNPEEKRYQEIIFKIKECLIRKNELHS